MATALLVALRRSGHGGNEILRHGVLAAGGRAAPGWSICSASSCSSTWSCHNMRPQQPPLLQQAQVQQQRGMASWGGRCIPGSTPSAASEAAPSAAALFPGATPVSEGTSACSLWDTLMGHASALNPHPSPPGSPTLSSASDLTPEVYMSSPFPAPSLLPSSSLPSPVPLSSSSTDLLSSLAAASAPEAAGHMYRITLFRDAADTLQWIHDTTGLPWWATIPLTSLTLRFALLPVSMFQARVVRSNFMVYREAVQLTDKQLGLSTSSLPGASGPGSTGESSTTATAQLTPAERVRRGKLVLGHFGLLRSKLGAPHPIWIIINPMIQVPVFVVVGVTLRMMGSAKWPGLSEEGALWFTDLTKVALIPPGADGLLAFSLPMGPAGFLLPIAIFGMTLTSLRMGLGAAIARPAAGSLPAVADDWVGKLLRVLPPLLYTMSVVNLWVKLQLPHAALLHWAASSGFTLGLQLALRQPGFRDAFKLPSPKELQEVLGRLSNQRLLELTEAGGALAPSGRGYVPSQLPDALVKQVHAEVSADVLVILGAQHSAQKRYREALFCLDRALQLAPAHVRGHYSRGQVFSLANRWPDAEAAFRRAAELAATDAERGQATYCVATALHTQGKLEAAVEAYRAAAEQWAAQRVVVVFSLTNALVELQRLEEAAEVVAQALASEPLKSSPPQAPFKQQLLRIQQDIAHRRQQRSAQQGAGAPPAAEPEAPNRA